MAAIIVGVGGGAGTLNFQGKSYRLRVGGVSAGTIGVAGVDASNLRTAADIAAPIPPPLLGLQ